MTEGCVRPGSLLKGAETMCRSCQVVAIIFVVFASGSAASATRLESRYHEVVTKATPPTQSTHPKVEEITALQTFTHIAYIPAGADLSSIKFKSLRSVKVATLRRAVTDPRLCNLPWSDPGGSMDCPRIADEVYVPAYRVSYS
jgi:hypothetical protein